MVRKTKEEIEGEFEKARPRILGALLDAVSCALKNLPTVTIRDLPRMADFAKWVVAAEPALPWKAGGFMQAYKDNLNEAASLALEASPVAQALIKLLRGGKEPLREWQGLCAKLLTHLPPLIADVPRQQCPGSASALANAINRVIPALKSVGIEVTSDRTNEGRKFIFRDTLMPPAE